MWVISFLFSQFKYSLLPTFYRNRTSAIFPYAIKLNPFKHFHVSSAYQLSDTLLPPTRDFVDLVGLFLLYLRLFFPLSSVTKSILPWWCMIGPRGCTEADKSFLCCLLPFNETDWLCLRASFSTSTFPFRLILNFDSCCLEPYEKAKCSYRQK